MEKRNLVHDGTEKYIYATDDPDVLLVSYKDEASDLFGLKKGAIPGKGAICNQVTNHLMQYLEKQGISTHFIRQLNERETLIKKVSIIPLAVVVRNISAGSFAERYGVEEGIVFDEPTLEFYLKNNMLGDPLINTYHAVALKLASREEIETMKERAFLINALLKQYLKELHISLVDFRLEFGRCSDGSLMLADEISPDNCRFWDSETHFRLDKDRFRRDMGNIEDAYREIIRRIMGES